jgi:protochlorophyllide reductase
MSFWYRLKTSIYGAKPPAPTFLPEHYPDLTGKYFLITGSSAGVGYEASKLLLEKNVTLVMVNRNIQKTEASLAKMKEELKDTDGFTEDGFDKRVITIQADLADLTTIKPAAEKILASVPHLDCVIFNAGVMQPPNGSLTAQGYELQFGCNVMGHQLLLELIKPAVFKAAELNYKPRVVFVASLAHINSPPGGLSWDFKDASRSHEMSIYGQSKAGNIYQASWFGREYASKGIKTVAVHPGYLNSELQRHYPAAVKKVAQFLMYPPIYGAYTELFAALSPEVDAKPDGFTGYVSAFGWFGELRPDVKEGTESGIDTKMIDWIEKEIEQYK